MKIFDAVLYVLFWPTEWWVQQWESLGRGNFLTAVFIAVGFFWSLLAILSQISKECAAISGAFGRMWDSALDAIGKGRDWLIRNDNPVGVSIYVAMWVGFLYMFFAGGALYCCGIATCLILGGLAAAVPLYAIMMAAIWAYMILLKITGDRTEERPDLTVSPDSRSGSFHSDRTTVS